jgi:general stress protein 26
MDKVLKRAAEIIQAKTNYVGGGMEGTAVITTIDDQGYPVLSTKSLIKADGINWITFATSKGDLTEKRLTKNNKAALCFSSSEYNISLTGTFELLDDLATKKANWLDLMSQVWSGADDQNIVILKFTTKKYSVFITEFGEEDDVVRGSF